MSRAPCHGVCLKSVSRTITNQGFILPAITAAEKCTLFLDSSDGRKVELLYRTLILLAGAIKNVVQTIATLHFNGSSSILQVTVHPYRNSTEFDIPPALDELTTACNEGQAKPDHGACMKSMSRTNNTCKI